MQIAFALLLVIAAASIGPLALVGLPESFASSGQDAGDALLFLHGFAAEFSQGVWWPRWLFGGNRGFGSPAFMFYPPLAYWVATGAQKALHLDGADALVLSAILWRVGASILAYLWLRTWMRPRAALFGTALFSLHVYNMLVDPLIGFTYAEMAGSCIMLLGLMAAGSRRVLVWVPAAFALLTVTHLPLAVMAGGVLPAWSFVAAGAGREGLIRAGKTLAGCALGAALAAAYLLPALLLLPEIYAEGWENSGLTTWPGHFLLDAWSPSKPVVQFLFLNAGLLVILASLPILAWIGHRQAPPQQDRFFLATAALLLALCLLMTSLSWPIWSVLPPLQRVQFPWRFMVFAVAIWAMLIGWRLDRLAATGARHGMSVAIAIAVLFGVMALWIPYSAVTAEWPSFARYDWTRLQFAESGLHPLPARNPPEYAPRPAALLGWRADDPATDAILLAALARSRAAAPGVEIERENRGGLRIHGLLRRPASLVLPQLAFPGWSKAGEPAGAALSADPATGLLRIDLPSGSVDMRVFRVATRPEQIGWATSAIALLLWLFLAVRAGHSRLAYRTGSPVPRPLAGAYPPGGATADKA